MITVAFIGIERKRKRQPNGNMDNHTLESENTPIYTTYLGFLNKHGGANKVAQKLGSCFVYYVMLHRGNDAVAPNEDMLKAFLKLKKVYTTDREQEELWKQYEENYLIQIGLSKEALAWMEKRAQEAKSGNILLVCFERDAGHCHRRLLAQEIERRFGAKYEGELSIYPSLFSKG